MINISTECTENEILNFQSLLACRMDGAPRQGPRPPVLPPGAKGRARGRARATPLTQGNQDGDTFFNQFFSEQLDAMRLPAEYAAQEGFQAGATYGDMRARNAATVAAAAPSRVAQQGRFGAHFAHYATCTSRRWCFANSSCSVEASCWRAWSVS